MNNRRDAEVKVTEEWRYVDLIIDDEFQASWDVPIGNPEGHISVKTVNSIIKAAYECGYDAAKKDLKQWID